MEKLVCVRCQTGVTFSGVSNGYWAYCPTHDEDLYRFECEIIQMSVVEYKL